jgi:uncharacterized protein (DUF2267 family)
MNAKTMYSRVGIEADLESLEEARHVTAVVLRALRDRLTPEEAEQASAQLPAELKQLWHGDAGTMRPPVKMHRQEFYERVRAEAGLPSVRTAALATDAVFAALKDQISDGECGDILAQLPRDLKQVWMHA